VILIAHGVLSLRLLLRRRFRGGLTAEYTDRRVVMHARQRPFGSRSDHSVRLRARELQAADPATPL